MFGGKFLNKTESYALEILISILKNQKKDEKIISLFEKLNRIFKILAHLDSKIYQIYLQMKKIKNPNQKQFLLNLVPFLSIIFSILSLVLISKIKVSKSLKVDIKIISKHIVLCIEGNLNLIKENIKTIKK
ncbi:MAG: hypothetical protein ACK4ZM_02920 [bacterium]